MKTFFTLQDLSLALALSPEVVMETKIPNGFHASPSPPVQSWTPPGKLYSYLEEEAEISGIYCFLFSFLKGTEKNY